MFLADKKTFSLDMISGLEEYAIIKAHEYFSLIFVLFCIIHLISERCHNELNFVVHLFNRGKVVFVSLIPRPLLSEAKKISGITRPGIYYLINENDENKIAQIYIGQTRNFWGRALPFSQRLIVAKETSSFRASIS